MKDPIGEKSPDFEIPLVTPTGQSPAPADDVMESIRRTLSENKLAVDLDRGGGS